MLRGTGRARQVVLVWHGTSSFIAIRCKIIKILPPAKHPAQSFAHDRLAAAGSLPFHSPSPPIARAISSDAD
jgi:hypothetical protein